MLPFFSKASLSHMSYLCMFQHKLVRRIDRDKFGFNPHSVAWLRATSCRRGSNRCLIYSLWGVMQTRDCTELEGQHR